MGRFKDCTVKMDEYKGEQVITVKFADGELAASLTKKATLDETIHDFMWI